MNEKSLEFQLLVSASKFRPDSNDKYVVQTLSKQDNFDWKLFFSLAHRHKVYPRVWNNLSNIVPDILSKEIIEERKTLFRSHLMHCMAITGQLYKVAELLNTHNITHIPYKGPVLATYLYDNINMRSYGDLDILISLEDLQRVYTLLSANGYFPEFDIAQKQITAYALAEDNLSFLPSGQGVPVEIHWELSGRYLANPLGMEHVSQKLSQEVVQRREFPIFSPEDMLVYFCLHGTKHEWEQLDLVACLAELILKEKELSWSFVFDVADKFKCRRMVHIGLLLAHKIYRIELPENVLATVIADKKASVLSEMVFDNLHKVENLGSSRCLPAHDTRFSILRLQARDSFLDAIRYQLRILFFPTKSEWTACTFPPWLTIGYWIVRPFRVLWATVAGTIAGKWRN